MLLISLICAEVIEMKLITGRKRSKVCSRYNSDFYAKWGQKNFDYFPFGYPPKDQCSIPKYNKTEDDKKGIKTYNFVRWITGLNDNIFINDTFHDTQCACALYCYYNGLNHHPSESKKCYSTNASIGCGTSNLAGGSASSAAAILGYYYDYGDPNPGHRLWLLSRSMKQTSFCGVGGASALKTFGMATLDKPHEIDFVASPPPGPVPPELIPADNGVMWTFWGRNMSTTLPKVTVKQNGTAVPIVTAPYFGEWGERFVGFRPNITAKINTKFDVEIAFEQFIYKYSIYITNCSVDMSDYEYDQMMGRKSYGITWQQIVTYCILAITIVVLILGIVCACIKGQIICVASSVQYKTESNSSTRSTTKTTIIETKYEVPPEPKPQIYSVTTKTTIKTTTKTTAPSNKPNSVKALANKFNNK
ncbi:hypothetical protein TVAG_443430 [Trichomonas vaginalis G3]|uniref:SCP domain-containing protein n=1 Tax=Trichomonas vaginalis (strain ATCC PRA-98 / G3) TaxID=412133 RepID=A2F3Q5_TRIV3|nr:hypothetical protein TVAG_443430 [Trichomonas vaginalis G3]|eukprot:XP_001313402.1 hypothetical protein [Trichomonas vaginalis G3]